MLIQPQVRIHKAPGIHRLPVGIVQKPTILTPAEWAECSNSRGQFLYCASCWTPHPFNMALPGMCSRCDHLMLIVRQVSYEDVLQGRMQSVLDLAFDRSLNEIYAQEDARVFALLDAAGASG